MQPRWRLQRHWKSKLFALFLATVAWFTMVSRYTELLKNVDVTVHVIPPKGVAVLPPKTQHILGTFRGPEGKLKRIRRPVEAEINLAGEVKLLLSDQLSRQTIPITIKQEHFDLPSEVTLVSAEPDRIQVSCERQIDKSVEVRPRFYHLLPDNTKEEVKLNQSTRGIVADGYEIDWPSTRARPPKVTISGPESVINKLQHIDTEPYDISGLNAQAAVSVKTVDTINDPELGPVPIEAKSVVLDIGVREEHKERVLKDVPIYLIRPKVSAFSVTIHDPATRNEITTRDLALIGPANVIDNLTPRDKNVLLAVDLRDITEPVQQLEVALWIRLPDKVRRQSNVPLTVNITVSPISPAAPAKPAATTPTTPP